MITITNIRNVNYNDYDEVWAVVRSMKNPNPRMKHVPELGPSWDLFKKYMNLRDNANWNKDTFAQIYVPQFLHEMTSEPAMRKMMELTEASNAGKHVCLVCFCPNETLCHRSILAGLLQGTGFPVNGVGQDYSAYFTEYNRILHETPEERSTYYVKNVRQ